VQQRVARLDDLGVRRLRLFHHAVVLVARLAFFRERVGQRRQPALQRERVLLQPRALGFFLGDLAGDGVALVAEGLDTYVFSGDGA
jgi:hypothetical protein